MKRAIILFLSLLSLAFVPSTPTSVTVAWDAATGIDLFKVYQSSSLALAPANWTVITNVAGTNSSATFQVIPGQQWFFVTASNFWGESGPSNLASVPAIPAATNVSIRRAP